MSVRKISILGVTGSVGKSTVDVVLSQAERFDVQAVTAHRNVDELASHAKALGAKQAVIADPDCYDALKKALSGTEIKASAGRQALLEAASIPCDVVMGAIVGFEGLEPIMKAIEAGSNVALANKEPLVAAGPLVIEAANRHGVKLLPVDSEHNAIFQVFDDRQRAGIERIILTASGGPFREWSKEQMAKATPEQAVAHPNWTMGRKISVDSATLMNKALEVIEARYLFDMPPEQIDVLVHPQSIIHSMVEYADGSVLAQLGAPDMKTPIAYCLGWPDRIATPGQKLDLTQLVNLELQPLDNDKFRSVSLAFECLKTGAAHCVAFNAINEVAVQAFLDGVIGFNGIVQAVEEGLQSLETMGLNSIEAVVSFDTSVRQSALSYIHSDKVCKSGNSEVHAA